MVTSNNNSSLTSCVGKTDKDTTIAEIQSIPRWHFAMLNDHQRNQAFFDAIEATDFVGKTVLDIGTGTGLLAMLIARRGAQHVYTCECNELVAEKAKEIIKANGLQERITVINKLSTDLLSGIDIPKELDVLVSETVDCGFFGEGFGYALLHAQSNLLKADAEIIPGAVSLTACLLSSQEVANLNYIYDDIFGLDVSAFNSFRTQGYFPVRLNTWEHRLISNAVDLYESSFYTGFSFNTAEQIIFSAQANALAHGVVFWFNLKLKDDIVLSNDPHNPRSHWMQAVHLFEHPVYVRRGHDYQVDLSISPKGVKFSDSLMASVLENIAS
ncbi:ribosomal protein L11 methyltransferase [Pseudomonas luteola]|uniref:Ribosomal protein L11 methyltransferase n=1 Tax=Pseudomonas luteola TaxID=47886 RepID=A0A2X2CY77_PSELU|nr:50S ribosomal protein L11 methyltransferase [Pseudomonas luteola]MCG7374136.1 50S ribosomal protein L11 methyltransferase [Pseudomonas luteola]SPZ04875.1 ribosomal protein L11 methyltransferase [Pseudomonas luteola]